MLGGEHGQGLSGGKCLREGGFACMWFIFLSYEPGENLQAFYFVLAPGSLLYCLHIVNASLLQPSCFG